MNAPALPPPVSALDRLTTLLLRERNAAGHWTGELSSSALSTAVAVIALGQLDRTSGSNDHAALVESGLQWLADHQNEDGGWGDTIRSRSNISTTALVWAAFGAADTEARFQSPVRRAAAWLTRAAGSLENLPAAIAQRYGRDRTFSVPILMTLALSGRLGPRGWRLVPALPFELAVLPRGLFGALKLPVVSYALPALIAIGQAIHHHAPSRNPLIRSLRSLCRAPTLRLLSEIQPSNGGFLEATPLTAFVTMSLAAAGHARHPATQKAASFLRSSVRPDGSWPIDTNLATWVTTLAIKALAPQPDLLKPEEKERLRAWLLGQQTTGIHAYTRARPGAWAWTDLPGGVPDADDTAGALLALDTLGPPDASLLRAAEAGVTWLLDLQNSDGGIPTFCPGWGALPFDRSTPEITAHALRAWTAWRPRLNDRLQRRLDRAIARALRFLESHQRPDGAFIPLWFGNEHVENDENPVYGTAQVLIALNEISKRGAAIPRTVANRAAQYLARIQHSGGGWGGGNEQAPETIEETALALEALSPFPEHRALLRSGLNRLHSLLEADSGLEPAPIGLYFARLWYFERLYPLLFSIGALGRIDSQNR